MRHLSTLLLLSFLFYLACDKDQTTFLLENELPNANDVRTYLRQAMYNNVLVLEVDSTLERDISYCILKMEDGSVVYFKKKWLDSISLQPHDWRIRFVFNDGIRQDALFLGDSIYINDTSIFLNPFTNAPLTAIAKADMPLKGRFAVKVFGRGENGIAIEGAPERFAAFHEIPILGLYADSENEVEITFMSQNGQFRAAKRISIQTEPILGIPAPKIIKNDLPNDNDDLIFLADRKIGLDQRGEIRWIYTGDARYL